jgi:hypothetical protein
LADDSVADIPAPLEHHHAIAHFENVSHPVRYGHLRDPMDLQFRAAR